MAHLPWPIHFIAQTPVTHLPGALAAVLSTEVADCGALREIAVLHPLLRFGPRAGAEVGADIRLDAHQFAVIERFVRAEAVVFDGAPGHVQTFRTFVARADAIHPVVVRGEVAAGPAQNRDVQIADRLHHVFAIAVAVRQRRAFLEDAALDAAAEVFGEVAVDLRIDGRDDAVGIDADARLS